MKAPPVFFDLFFASKLRLYKGVVLYHAPYVVLKNVSRLALKEHQIRPRIWDRGSGILPAMRSMSWIHAFSAEKEEDDAIYSIETTVFYRI